MTSMHASEERSARRFRDYRGPGRHLPVAVEPGSLRVVAERTADSFSARLIAADQDRQRPAVLGVRGELDLGTAPVLLEVLLPVLERGTGPLVMDLSEVSFMDSTGVHVLTDTLRRLEPQNRGLVITCREHGQVHRLLAVMGLLDVGRAPLTSVFADDPRRHEEADLAGPTIALAMARTREPARPAVLSPARWLGNHTHSAEGS